MATNLETRARSVAQAQRNAGDGISLLGAAESGLGSIIDIHQRIAELATQAATEAITAEERAYLQAESNGLFAEYERIASETTYGSHKLFDGTFTDMDIQVGVNGGADNRVKVSLPDMAPNALLGQATPYDLSTASAARDSLVFIRETAVPAFNEIVAGIGAAVGRLESAWDFSQSYKSALTSASAEIMDLDFAQASPEMARYQVQQAAGVSVMRATGSLPGVVLSLLG
jgi:flagellin